jgi:hypothetical protein
VGKRDRRYDDRRRDPVRLGRTPEIERAGKTGRAHTDQRVPALILAALLASILSSPCDATQRSASARAAFAREYPCPATGRSRGPCPGYVVDHVVPLCAGGADHPSNMQWQTAGDARAKDVDERRLCRAERIHAK